MQQGGLAFASDARRHQHQNLLEKSRRQHLHSLQLLDSLCKRAAVSSSNRTNRKDLVNLPSLSQSAARGEERRFRKHTMLFLRLQSCVLLQPYRLHPRHARLAYGDVPLRQLLAPVEASLPL